MTKPQAAAVSRNYDQMRALWSRYGSSVFGCEIPADPEEIAFVTRGKSATRMQTFRHVDGNGDDIARITRFWYEDGTTDDLVFYFRWDGVTYVLSDW
jgi:hypothetical protein